MPQGIPAHTITPPHEVLRDKSLDELGRIRALRTQRRSFLRHLPHSTALPALVRADPGPGLVSPRQFRRKDCLAAPPTPESTANGSGFSKDQSRGR